mmetsp:Transcript_99376/g.303857  ORF Transcript_99376/g.303857 Transcript_99376/m.303857 type:complete len:235 (-) Transcript_99376:436-1140(-)
MMKPQWAWSLLSMKNLVLPLYHARGYKNILSTCGALLTPRKKVATAGANAPWPCLGVTFTVMVGSGVPTTRRPQGSSSRASASHSSGLSSADAATRCNIDASLNTSADKELAFEMGSPESASTSLMSNEWRQKPGFFIDPKEWGPGSITHSPLARFESSPGTNRHIVFDCSVSFFKDLFAAFPKIGANLRPRRLPVRASLFVFPLLPCFTIELLLSIFVSDDCWLTIRSPLHRL